MTQIIAFTRLHYGLDYLEWVIKSSEGFADKHVCLYTPSPTFGRATHLPCPDARDDLHRVAHETGKHRMHWVEGMPVNIKSVYALYPDADMILELDADEVIAPGLAANILKDYQAGYFTKREYRLAFMHHWRTFGYVCKDAAFPMRLFLPNNPPGEEYYALEKGYVHHFGYARKVSDVDYKIRISMHADEWRPEWWQEIFLKFPDRLADLHPVCLNGFWNAEEYDKWDLPEILHNHPYFDSEVIE
jgi:hypothetical protein